VAHNENPFSSVPGTDAASWNNERPDGIPFTFQVRTAMFEFHADDSSNILSNDPRGPELPHNSKHFRPEVTVILFASSLPGEAERLAGESPADEGRPVDASSPLKVTCRYIADI